MPGTFFLYPQQIIDSPGQQFILNNAAITADGYQVISGFGSNELVLVINIKNAPTGTLPTLTFTMQEVDPIDQTTVIGSAISSAALNGTGITILTKSDGTVGTVKVSWHIGGTSVPTFTGVNVTMLQRVAGSSVEITDGTNTLGTPTHPIKIDPTGTTTQPVSGTVTANAGTGSFTVAQATAANLNATVTGSVTANVGTTNGLALDATLTGGAQTTRITNGTSTAAVKAASTAPAITDPSLVVAVSPNNSGTNAVQTNGNFPEGTIVPGNINPIVVAGHDVNGRSSILNVDGYGNLKVITSATPAGASTGVAFGQANTGGTAGALAPLRATTYTEQTTAAQRSLKSTSALDTAAGTGAQTVMITYYNASLNGPFTETVTLNGLTAVATVNTNICFIENMIVMNVGSTGSNQGTISLFATNNGTGTVIGSIGVGNVVTAGTVGDNRTLWAHHYVPTGISSYLTTVTAGTTGNQTGIIFVRVNDPLISTDSDKQITGNLVVANGGSSIFMPSTIPLVVNGPARITQYAVSNGTNTTFFGSFEFSDIF